MAKVTNKDIATLAGVSQAAVSMAIHGRKGISEATRAHILRIARELQYEPPSRLYAESVHTLVLLVDSDDPCPACCQIHTLLSAAEQQGMEVRICTLQQALEKPYTVLAGCDLLVAAGEVDRAVLSRLAPLAAKVLIIDGAFLQTSYFNIRLSYDDAAYALTNYLAELGHRNFLYINQALPHGKNLICFNGFQRLILERQTSLFPDQIIMDCASDPSQLEQLPQVINLRGVSACICTSDQAAVQVCNCLRAAGFQVPQDVSVAALVQDDTFAHPGFSFTRISLNQNQIEPELSLFASHPKLMDTERDVLIRHSAVIVGDSTCPPKFNPATKKLAIALYLKDHPTYRVVRAGFLNQVHKMGYQAEVAGISDYDEASFNRVCTSLAELHVDGAVLCAPAPEALQVLKQAGIPVVCLHNITQNTPADGICSSITADPKKIAQTVADFFAEQLSSRSGSIAVSQSEDNQLESAITQEFIRLMKHTHPNIRVLDDLRFADHTMTNVRLVTSFIEQTPDLLGAFTTAGSACITWAEARKAVGRADMIIVGTDYTEDTVERIIDGDVQAFVAQPVYEEAQTSVIALDAILRGKQFPPFCTLDAPLVTRENVEKYSRLLQDVRNWFV